MKKFDTIVESVINEIAIPFTKKWKEEKEQKRRDSWKTNGWEQTPMWMTNGKDKAVRWDNGKDLAIYINKWFPGEFYVVWHQGEDIEDDMVVKGIDDTISFVKSKLKVKVSSKEDKLIRDILT